MPEKAAIYSNGWGGEIYASHLKNGSWTVTFRVDAGEYGVTRETFKNIRSPKQFVHALYKSDGIEMGPQEVESALSVLHGNAPAFAVACSVFNQTEDGETDFSEEDYLSIFPTFLRSNPQFPSDFNTAKQDGKKLFEALLECKSRGNLLQSVSIESKTYPIVWVKRVSEDLQELLDERLIAEHCEKAEWQKSTGHSHAAIGNGHKYGVIKKFASAYYAEHGKLPIGDFVIGSDFIRGAGYNLGQLAVKFQ